MTKNPILICTFLALTSGFFGSYVGGQIALMFHSQKCQNQSWGLQQICQVWITPGATWKGSTTGIWTGTILGAFTGGLIIRENRY
ncbi:hypothetical protein H6G36_21815 [Anabaena minutissima FACHB-250]|uniref:hypothetical protein n=1 Tax=Anabaena sp. CCY 9402-a TaxID=3103867 RepID=UPI001686EF89|nr:hypothetical protein [Anabaena minutissima FACHB-250]